MAPSKNRRVVVASGAIGLLACAGAAQAQFILRDDSGWLEFPAGGGVPHPYSIFHSNGADPPMHQQAFSGGTHGLNRMGLRAGSWGLLPWTVTDYTFQTRWMRTFRVTEDATLSLPNMLNALTGHNGTTVGRIDSRLTLQRRTGPGPNDFEDVSFFGYYVLGETTNSPPQNAILDSLWAAYTTDVGPGEYRVLMTLQVAGATLGHSAVGTVATFGQPDSRPRGGFMASLAAIPQGLNHDSRAAVRAPLARSHFRVSGNLINVGVLEQGQIYDLHASVRTRNVSGVQTPRAITTRLGPNAVAGADYRDDHTLAVASIIGGGTGTDAQLGIAPGVNFFSAPTWTYAASVDALDALIADNVRIVNMSAFDNAFVGTDLDRRIQDNPRLTFVKSAGNDSLRVAGSGGNTQPAGSNTLTQPGRTAFNVITVGALNRDFTRRADFSSFNDSGTGPVGPTLVAPGEYIEAANFMNSRGTDGQPHATSFGRVFTGNDFDRRGGATTGAISGTSFAAPHVTGAVALMHEYASQHRPAFDDDSIDHRVTKAVLVNSAKTAGIHRSTYTAATNTSTQGGPWAQETNGGTGAPGNVLVVRRSLDPQLGGGMLDVYRAMETFASGEILISDTNTERIFNIDASDRLTGPNAPPGLRAFWDLERVSGSHGAGNEGMVNYLLGDITGFPFRSTLAWDRLFPAGSGPGGILPGLQLRLYLEGLNPGNMPGFDFGDVLLAETVVGTVAFENVKLFDFLVPDPGAAFPPGSRDYFLQVFNPSNLLWTYGVAVQVPTPGMAAVLVLAGVLAARRRRV